MDPVTVAEIVGGAVGTGGAGLGVVAAKRAVDDHGAPALIWRWFSGHPLDGHHRTDATWFGRGRKQTHQIGRPISRWHYRPRIHRAGIRTSVTWGAGMAGYGLLFDPALTIDSMAGAGALGLSVACWRAVLGIRNWRHHRTYVAPLHTALAPRLGVPEMTRPHEWLAIPRSFAKTDGAEVIITLPKDLSAVEEARKVIKQVAGAKLGIEDPQVRIESVGMAPRAVIKLAAPPPRRLGFEEFRPLMEKASDTAPVLGLGRSGKVVTADLEAESPHILIQAGSGGGKSELTATILVQRMHRGDVVLILDIKRMSHRWAKGLPNVRYCRSVAEIHQALLELPIELNRRTELADNLADMNGDLPPDVNLGPRIWTVIEEMNMLKPRLDEYWKEIKEKSDPAQSPAIKALNESMFAGRAVMMNDIAVGQSLTSTTFGGPHGEGRENFAIRCLTRASKRAYKLHAPDVNVRKTTHLGRWQVIVGDSAKETQAGYLTNEEKRKYALSGIVTPFPDLTVGAAGWTQPVGSLTAPQVEVLSDSLEEQPVSLTGAPEGPSLHVVGGQELTGLREAVENGIVPISLAALRWARANDPEFPEAKGKRGQEMLYPAEDLIRWERNRERNRDDDEAAG
ncbi:MAG TPA: hypothetical protein VHZ03_31795 [Trebonia sp.]|jgi:hypothetical protein|nr:hypothetical protein [Trebonia sp.]